MNVRIGYLVPEFPSQTHAFFWREITALRDSGAQVELFSTRPPEPGSCRHPFGEEARLQTTYLNRPRPTTLAWLLARPVGLLRALAYITGLRESSVVEKLRALPLIAAAAELGRMSGEKQLGHVHLHSCANAAHVGALARRLCGLRYSLTLHGDMPVYGKDHASKAANAAWISAVTRPLREQLLTNTVLRPEQVPVITMGVDVDRFMPRPKTSDSSRPQLVTVARLIAEKGHRDALAALQRLAARGQDFHYTIAGDGPERESLETLAVDLGLEDRVTFAGNLGEDAVKERLEQADVFLLPSYGLGEAAPVCVMEAMASGLPVVCSTIGGTPDMVEDGTDGFLTPQRQPEVLAEVLGRLLADACLRKRIGAGARRTAEARFDYRLTARQLLRHFRHPETEQAEAGHRPEALAAIS